MNRLTVLLAALCMSVMSLVAQQTAQIRQLMDSTQYAEAVQLCTIELQQYPKNGMLYRYRAIANIMQEQYGMALQDIDMLLKYVKTSGISVSEVYELRGATYMYAGELQKALDDYTTAIKKDKKNADAYAARGELYYHKENYAAALADYKAASKLVPAEDSYLVEIARCTLQLGKYDEARAMLTSITVLYPYNAEAWRLSAGLAMLSDETTKFIDQYIRYLNLSYNETGRFGDTDMLIAAADTEYPYLLNAVSEQISHLTDYPQLFYMGVRVRIYIEKGYYADAIKDLDMMERIEGTADPFVLANRADCYQNLYQYRKAIADLTALLNINADYAYAYLNRGCCYTGIGDYTNALNDFSYVIQNHPSYAANGYYLRTIVQWEQKRYDNALSDISRCIELNPAEGAYLWRGRLELIQGDTAKAKVDFEQVLAMDTTIDGSSVRQYALHFLGQDTEALAWMDSILVVEPTNDNYYDAACLYALMGRTEQALSAFDKALSLGYRDFQHIAADTDLDAIRDLPRFTEILNKYRKQEVQSKFDLLKGADTDMK